jgi:hypothetical protein
VAQTVRLPIFDNQIAPLLVSERPHAQVHAGYGAEEAEDIAGPSRQLMELLGKLLRSSWNPPCWGGENHFSGRSGQYSRGIGMLSGMKKPGSGPK